MQVLWDWRKEPAASEYGCFDSFPGSLRVLRRGGSVVLW
jgi:hypothetical protein